MVVEKYVGITERFLATTIKETAFINIRHFEF